MTVFLDKAPRKCGNLVKKGCYGGATPEEGGILTPAFLWAEIWEGAKRPMVQVGDELPSRTQVAINPRRTLATKQLRLYDPGHLMRRNTPPHIAQWGLADHVGSSHYVDPFDFTDECGKRGPNRRMSPENAKQWAERTPFPVLFSHSKIPLFESQGQAERALLWMYEHGYCSDGVIFKEFAATAKMADENLTAIQAQALVLKTCRELLDKGKNILDWKPTWQHPDFGMCVGSYKGTLHPAHLLTHTLYKMSTDQFAQMPAHLRPGRQRALWYADWFVYIAQAVDSEDEFDLNLADYGVEVGIIS